MRLREKMKNLKWFIENKEKIEKILKEYDKKDKKDNKKGFSLAGIPDFQRGYVNDLLEKEK
jgi:hypothetical protein